MFTVHNGTHPRTQSGGPLKIRRIADGIVYERHAIDVHEMMLAESGCYEIVGKDVPTIRDHLRAKSRAELADLCKGAHLSFGAHDSADDLVHRLALHCESSVEAAKTIPLD